MRKILYNGQVLVDLDALEDKYTKAEIDAMISSVFVYKGTLATKADLNALTGMKLGDCYNVEEDGANYAWNGTEWDRLSATIDLSAYYTSSQVDALIAGINIGNYLAKDNTIAYIPTQPYHPATKQYVDDLVGSINEVLATLVDGEL